MLLFNCGSIPLVDTVYFLHDPFADELVIGGIGELHDQFVPGVLRTRHLFVEGSACLEQNSIGEDGDSSCWVQIRSASSQFHNVKANKADIDDIAGHRGYGDAISDLDPIPSNNEKIRSDREKNCLKSYSNACCDKA